ncbi:MAG: signal peptide peptidase SppA [Lachnospiraceae bacterium]|nr:signal peptide peptidase SppA [Lachnospiraceae bacterium]
MKIKQLAGIIIAGLVFMLVSVTGVFVNQYTKDNLGNKALEIVDRPVTDYIGVIKIEGTIMSEETESLILGSTEGYVHSQVMEDIDTYMNDKANKAILLYINSPGGVVYDVDELYLRLLDYKESTGRPIYAYFAQYACSGGYYAAMAADEIYANRNTVTGSIGVVMSMYDMTGLFEKIGIREVDIVSGDNKAMGSSGLTLTEEQIGIYQSQIDESYEQFTSIVSEGRNMDIEKVKQLSDGRTYTAKQALDNSLIDGICRYDEYVNILKEKYNNDIVLYENEKDKDDFYSKLFGSFASINPFNKKSEYDEIKNELNKMLQSGNGVLMYYAEP